MSDQSKIDKLEAEISRLRARVEVLQERNNELRQWIIKLTNKKHPARKSSGSGNK